MFAHTRLCQPDSTRPADSVCPSSGGPDGSRTRGYCRGGAEAAAAATAAGSGLGLGSVATLLLRLRAASCQRADLNHHTPGARYV
jgi:hypothetical protein